MKRGWPAATAGTLLLVAGTIALRADRPDAFPHDAHSGLFPVCTGCHEGVPVDDPGTSFPEPTLCAECHDGDALDRVAWSGRESRSTNLDFSHRRHARLTTAMRAPTTRPAATPAPTSRPAGCEACHVPTDRDRMAVERTVVAQCLACHDDADRRHYVDADCATCHLPLARTGFTAARVAALPRPATHTRDDFLAAAHGDLAAADASSCVTCHTRETCATCHVDAGRSSVIAAVPPAGDSLELPPFEARYVLPASHESADFLRQHGALASPDGADCAACHARESCATCHVGERPEAVAALPGRAGSAARGVRTRRRAPPSHAAPFFDLEHGTAAATAAASCTVCHTRERCASCHLGTGRGEAEPVRGATERLLRRLGSARHGADSTGDGTDPNAERSGSPSASTSVNDTPSTRPATMSSRTGAVAGFHVPNYMARHAADAYGRTLECSNCHDARVFCSDCHERNALRPTGRLGRGFHDAEPLWLLRHPQAARQALESCASCHAQRDCMQCHAQTGAFRISPHGPGFDPRRAAARNPVICRACHLDDPLSGTIP